LKAGGVCQTGKYGQYVAWLEDFNCESPPIKLDAPKLLTATALGQHFDVSATKINL
jgi:hypothetical protein